MRKQARKPDKEILHRAAACPNAYSHATLLDHGGVLVNHFFPSAVPPRRAGSVTATRALRPGLSLHLTPYLASTGNWTQGLPQWRLLCSLVCR